MVWRSATLRSKSVVPRSSAIFTAAPLIWCVSRKGTPANHANSVSIYQYTEVVILNPALRGHFISEASFLDQKHAYLHQKCAPKLSLLKNHFLCLQRLNRSSICGGRASFLTQLFEFLMAIKLTTALGLPFRGALSCVSTGLTPLQPHHRNPVADTPVSLSKQSASCFCCSMSLLSFKD